MKKKILSPNFDKSALLAANPSASHHEMHRKVADLRAARREQIEYEGMLCTHMHHMFPDQERVNAVINNLKYQDIAKLPNDVYTDDYLPLHTRDNAWLIKYVCEVITQREPVGVRWNIIANFVVNSPAFNAVRCHYEERMIKTQLPYFLNNPIPRGILENSNGTYEYKYALNYDHVFRSKIIDYYMKELKIDENTIETALESNAELWRKQTMAQTFENRFYPLSMVVDIHKSVNDPWWKRFDKLKQAHQTDWLKMREYQYYRQHHKVIDQLKLATENMLMKPYEVMHLKKRLNKFSRIRENMLKDNSIMETYVVKENTL